MNDVFDHFQSDFSVDIIIPHVASKHVIHTSWAHIDRCLASYLIQHKFITDSSTDVIERRMPRIEVNSQYHLISRISSRTLLKTAYSHQLASFSEELEKNSRIHHNNRDHRIES